MLYLCKWKFEGRKTLPKTSAFTRGGQKTEEEFYRRRVKYHQHFSTLFSPLTVTISLADRWPSPALAISRAVAMRHAGALPVLYGLLVPWGRGFLRLAQHVEKGDTLKQGTPTTSGIQLMLFINESGLYSLILSSKLETPSRA